MSKKQLYRKDLISLIARETGFTIDDIKYILAVRDDVILQGIEQGVSFKDLKVMQLSIEEQKAKRAWDGLNKVHYNIPKKKVIKFKPLSELTKALEILNKKEEET